MLDVSRVSTIECEVNRLFGSFVLIGRGGQQPRKRTRTWIFEHQVVTTGLESVGEVKGLIKPCNGLVVCCVVISTPLHWTRRVWFFVHTSASSSLSMLADI